MVVTKHKAELTISNITTIISNDYFMYFLFFLSLMSKFHLLIHLFSYNILTYFIYFVKVLSLSHSNY